MREIRLTGNRRYRTNWRGQLILQVQVTGESISPCGMSDGREVNFWRDATVQDVVIL